MTDLNVQTLHSPFGANGHFAIGLQGRGGGFALEKSHVQNQDIFIGYTEMENIFMLPYFDGTKINPSLAFVKNYCENQNKNLIVLDNIQREMTLTGDTFSAGKVSACFISPFRPVIDICELKTEDIRLVVNPVVYLRLDFDNSAGEKDLNGFFAVGDMYGKYFFKGIKGVACREGYSFGTDEADAKVFGDFDIVSAYSKETLSDFPLAPVGGLSFDVAAGEKKAFDVVLTFFKSGQATHGTFEMPYFYTNYFRDPEESASFALENKIKQYSVAKNTDAILNRQNYSDKENFIICQSVKSYLGSTMLFGDIEKYKYVVNEGSYMMLNTCDLFIDHIFFELRFIPFAVKNQLISYYRDYSYYDYLEVGDKELPGGISFSHDMGAFNVFSTRGSSSYEIKDQIGCYSFMTAEELLNIILATSVYIKATDDMNVIDVELLFEMLESLENRDNPDPKFRNGGINFNSSMCGKGVEITTYDSLDHSLGLTAGSLYIAGKCMSAYLSLQYLFERFDRSDLSARAGKGAKLSCNLLLSAYNVETGSFPATVREDVTTPIIPIIEPLVYPYYLGIWDVLINMDDFNELINKMNTHMTSVLQVEKCLFDDYGYKLSQSSVNSWMSKVFLCKFIAERILKNERAMQISEESTNAHVKWWVEGCSTNPAIDQIFNGSQDERNFFYPRSVTSFLYVISDR